MPLPDDFAQQIVDAPDGPSDLTAPEPEPVQDDERSSMSVGEFKERLIGAVLPSARQDVPAESEVDDEPEADEPRDLTHELRRQSGISAEEFEELEEFVTERPDLQALLDAPESDEAWLRNVALVRRLYRGAEAEGTLFEQEQGEASELEGADADELLGEGEETFHTLDAALAKFGPTGPGFQRVVQELYENDPEGALRWWQNIGEPQVQRRVAEQAQLYAAHEQAQQQAAFEQETARRGEVVADFLLAHPEVTANPATNEMLHRTLEAFVKQGIDIYDREQLEGGLRLANEARKTRAHHSFAMGILGADDPGGRAPLRDEDIEWGLQRGAFDPMRSFDAEKVLPPQTVAEFKAGIVNADGQGPLEALGFDEQMKAMRKAQKEEELRRAGF